MTLKVVRLTNWQSGQPSSHSRFARVEFNRQASRAVATDVVYEPLDEQGRQEGTMTARTGDGKLGDGIVELGGGVRWTSGTDVALTDSCTVDMRAQLIRGSQHVEFTGPGYRASGMGFTAETSGARRLNLLSDVRAFFDDELGATTP